MVPVTVEDEQPVALKQLTLLCASDGTVHARLASGAAMHGRCTAVAATYGEFSQHVREAYAVLTCVL